MNPTLTVCSGFHAPSARCTRTHTWPSLESSNVLPLAIQATAAVCRTGWIAIVRSHALPAWLPISTGPPTTEAAAEVRGGRGVSVAVGLGVSIGVSGAGVQVG